MCGIGYHDRQNQLSERKTHISIGRSFEVIFIVWIGPAIQVVQGELHVNTGCGAPNGRIEHVARNRRPHLVGHDWLLFLPGRLKVLRECVYALGRRRSGNGCDGHGMGSRYQQLASLARQLQASKHQSKTARRDAHKLCNRLEMKMGNKKVKKTCKGFDHDSSARSLISSLSNTKAKKDQTTNQRANPTILSVVGRFRHPTARGPPPMS